MFEDQKNIWGNLIKGFSNNPNNRQLANILKEGTRQAIGLTVADIPLSAKEAYDYAQKGEYLNSGLSAAAMIPGVPALGGLVKGQNIVPKIQGFHGSKTPLSGDVSLNFSGKTSGIPEERAFWLAPTKDEALKFADMAGGNHVTSFDINNSRVKQIPVSIQDITKNTLNKAEEIGKAKQEGFDVLHFVYPKSKYISLEDEFAVINPQVLQKTGEGYNKQFDNLHYTDPFPDTTR